MPRFETTATLAAPVERVFAVFLSPETVLGLMPPELRLQLLDAPQRLERGARTEVQGRRWGISHRLTTEVTALEPGARIVEEQRAGLFRRWVHALRFAAAEGGGTRLTDEIEYEPPGGVLGLALTPRRIEQDLAWALAHRNAKLAELLASNPPLRPAA